MPKAARANPHQDVIDRATLFTSVTFHGVGYYKRREYPSLAEAIKGAQAHANEENKAAMIYAVADNGTRQAFYANVWPEKPRPYCDPNAAR